MQNGASPIHHRLPLAGLGGGHWGGRGPPAWLWPDTGGSRPAGPAGGPGLPPEGRAIQHEWALGLCPLRLEVARGREVGVQIRGSLEASGGRLGCDSKYWARTLARVPTHMW